MKTIEVYSIQDLLLTKAIKYNFSNLAKVLNCSRNTVHKYEKDTDCIGHHVVKVDGEYVLFTKKRVSNK